MRASRRLPVVLALLAAVVALPACDSDDPVGDGPFAEAEANVGDWAYVSVPGATCRDGSGAGFGVRLQEDADDLMVFFEGGGGCLNSTTCATNPASFSAAQFSQFAATAGTQAVFSDDADNPVADWNVIYVPYCTGDLGAGSATDVAVDGVDGLQQFVGADNLDLFLDLIGPFFDDTDQLLVTGRSAGGAAALLNFATVADAFPNADRTLLDDSLPAFFRDDVFSPQLGGAFVQLWGLNEALPADAAPLFGPDGLEDIYAYYSDRYPGANLGLSSYLQDGTIRFFLGFGQADGTVTGAEYEAGLDDLRDQLPSAWATYYATGEQHTFLGTPDRFFSTTSGVQYADWLGSLISGDAPNVEPGLATRLASR